MFVLRLSQEYGIKYIDNTNLALTNRSAILTAAMVSDSSLTQVGPPGALQADNDTEFKGAAGKRIVLREDDTHEIIAKKVAESWPGCRMVNGSARYSQSQGPCCVLSLIVSTSERESRITLWLACGIERCN